MRVCYTDVCLHTKVGVDDVARHVRRKLCTVVCALNAPLHVNVKADSDIDIITIVVTTDCDTGVYETECSLEFMVHFYDSVMSVLENKLRELSAIRKETRKKVV